ncbi:hypothetical protein ACFFIX_20075 [Metabacillus herbersteinensis]|uniref:Lipoprotein n=1 Tax=Metabacillus herbersteinensis TaxID=283816 RepID=A0ABV6GJ20_9BACI
MKKKIIFGCLLFIVFLVGCLKEQTFEEFFHQEMKEMHIEEENYSYNLVSRKDKSLGETAISFLLGFCFFAK